MNRRTSSTFWSTPPPIRRLDSSPRTLWYPISSLELGTEYVVDVQNGGSEVIDSLYGLLSQLGFTHPLHPAITHLPMGMAMGSFLFSLGSLRYTDLARTARHCAILGVIFVPPTMALGILDWQYFYQGDWTRHIITKFVLAITLIVLFIAAIKAGGGEPKNPRLPILLHALCFLTAVGLGFTGGEIEYG